LSAASNCTARIDEVVSALPGAFPGPGGAVAVVKDGEVLVRHAWGYANAERRIAFTPKSLFRICSISKQFTCALLQDALPDPSVLDPDIAARLPRLEQPPPGVLHLAHNQSGLRDYWAIAMLHGAPAELPFGETEARQVIVGARSLQFAPGSRYSYCNQNFRLLGDTISDRLGESFSDLLRTRIFDRVGMRTALLAADTRALPDGTEGYEGDVASGFRPARNNLIWTGDAGIGASLDDMIAWEKHADAGRDNPESIYSRLTPPVAFADGAPAAYGFGLVRIHKFGRDITGHGGALRGWRSNRLHSPADRLSIVVMFNHLADAGAAAFRIMGAALGEPDAPAGDGGQLTPKMVGAWLEPQTGLSVRVAQASDRTLELRFGHHGPETLAAQKDGSASDGDTRLEWRDGRLWMLRQKDNQSSRLTPLAPGPIHAAGCAGRYWCEELAANLTITDAGGVLYGGFSGFLGQGRMELLTPIGPDVWALPCPRALDHTPPGDWTLAFHRADAGQATAVTVGCWLARGLIYERAQ
jgi:D-aminopeptidase